MDLFRLRWCSCAFPDLTKCRGSLISFAVPWHQEEIPLRIPCVNAGTVGSNKPKGYPLAHIPYPTIKDDLGSWFTQIHLSERGVMKDAEGLKSVQYMIPFYHCIGEFRAPFKQIQTTQSTELVGQVRVLFISFDFLMMRLRFHSCCGWCELSFYVVICGDVIWDSPNDGLSGTRWLKFNRGWPGALTYILLCPISFHFSLISFWAFIFCSSLEDDWGRLNWSSHQDARNLNMLDCVRRCQKRMSSALLTRSLSFTGTKARKDTKTLNEELQSTLEENCTSLSGHPSLHLVPAMSCKSLPLGTPRVKQI